MIFQLWQTYLGADYVAFIKCHLSCLCQNKSRNLLLKTLCLNKVKKKTARVDIYTKDAGHRFVHFMARKVNKQGMILLFLCCSTMLLLLLSQDVDSGEKFKIMQCEELLQNSPISPLFQNPLFSSHSLCKSETFIKHKNIKFYM